MARELPKDAFFGSHSKRSTLKRKLSSINGLQQSYSSPTTEKTTLQVDLSRIAQEFAERSDAKTVARTQVTF
jgi:hypothetical protein